MNPRNYCLWLAMAAGCVGLLMAQSTESSPHGKVERITVRTSVTLAFARSPTLLAYAAWDIAKLSDGRFELGRRVG